MSKKPSGADELDAMTAAVTADLEGARPRAPRSLPVPNQMMQVTHAVKDAREEVARLKAAQGRALAVEIALCDDGPHHATPLDLQRVADLQANLAENLQNSPAVVRPKAGGRFEIVAGRHRKQALINLGRNSWDVIVREMDDDTAERLTFYDNLLAPHYSDYEKYLGFAARRRSKALTLEQLATESGTSKTAVWRLMSFGLLPAKALDLISGAPKAVGATLAEALGALTDKHHDRVVEAVQLVVEGKLSASRAPAWVLEKKKAPTKKPVENVIRRGKATFAKVARRPGEITIRFADPDIAAEMQAGIEELLQARASRE